MKHYKKALKAILRETWEALRFIAKESYLLLKAASQKIEAWALRHQIGDYYGLAVTTFVIGIALLFMFIQFCKWPVIEVGIATTPLSTDFVDMAWFLAPVVSLVLVPVGLIGFAFNVHELLSKWHGPIIGLVDGLELEERIAGVANSDNGYNLLPMLASAYSALEDTNESLRSELRNLKQQREK